MLIVIVIVIVIVIRIIIIYVSMIVTYHSKYMWANLGFIVVDWKCMVTRPSQKNQKLDIEIHQHVFVLHWVQGTQGYQK